MSIELPQDLQSLEANSGIYAIWMIFHHYGMDHKVWKLIVVYMQSGWFFIIME